MKSTSPRARRLQRASRTRTAGLNLVSLMDIFTILVFFLLVNSSTAQQPQSARLKLPEARVEKPIEESLVIQIDDESIIVQGRKVADVATISGQEEPLIAPLVEELRYQASRRPLLEDGESDLQAVTVMADRELPFSLLKKLMVSSSEAGYGQISLAVIGLPQEDDRGQ
ncbi:ExbD/TolR family protein [Aestuariirhabdus litorea]|uniref:Biopolymer transporter ExbD n=1 Tax=Aestuariirhabdus litorea TaxID=2528527 RepID=A0A3P3VRY2_9GAMM|nr:biopolymer transporter ExbD [Aestuariirhabdus litorea]RRJ84269.1 biopolymer transporter ExbD [Aestuariirhabdus litorea]RWW97491.1 biopolymer transporter ExbD [Endozoicomonadaceae bacterium GTF-13]